MSAGPGNSALLARWMEEVYEVNLANGWFDEERSLDDEVVLLHSEVSEILEAYRRWGLDDATQPITDETEINLGKIPKPEGVGSEVADVLIRLLDLSKRHNLIPDRIATHAEALDFGAPDEFSACLNWMHREITGLLGGAQTHIVARVLRVVQVCSQRWGVDLAAEYTRKVEFNATRGYRHGGKRL